MTGRSLRRMPAAAVAVLALAASASAVTVAEIPTPRPHGWVVDLTGTLPAVAVQELNRLGDRVQGETGAELAVVVVSSVAGADPHDFAVQLFNRWGIGRAASDDGVLVFVALEDRAAEIVLGDGVAGAERRRASDEIMAEVMVPRFRRGQPAQAVVEGAHACARRILDVSPAAPEPTALGGDAASAAAGGLDSAAGARGGRVEALPSEQTDAGSSESRGGTPLRGLLAVLGLGWVAASGGALLAGLAALFAFAWRLKASRRRCPSCRGRLVKLDEASDDDHLTEPEKAEERLGSVDYQVWWCAACQKAVKRHKVNALSGYAVCQNCGARTSTGSETTLVAATEFAGGTVEVDEACWHCGHSVRHTYATPRREATNRAVSESRSSPSSQSQPSGFGGGHSSGRGSSGRW